jgi:hypothetical protein
MPEGSGKVIMNRKNKMLMLILILFIGCKKKKTSDITDQIRKDDLETENISTFENKPQVVSEEKRIVEQGKPVMKNIEPEQVEINIYGEYLREYFTDNDYVLLELSLSNRKIYFAEHYIKEQIWEDFFGHEQLEKIKYRYGNEKPIEKIFDIAVVFEIIDGKFFRYLLIKDFKFFNENNYIFDDNSNAFTPSFFYGIYGYKFIHRYRETDSVPPELTICECLDYGYYETEPFNIRWNEESKVYEYYNYLFHRDDEP